ELPRRTPSGGAARTEGVVGAAARSVESPPRVAAAGGRSPTGGGAGADLRSSLTAHLRAGALDAGWRAQDRCSRPARARRTSGLALGRGVPGPGRDRTSLQG